MSDFGAWIRGKFLEFQQTEEGVSGRIVNKTDFARYLHVRQQNLSRWMLGKTKPTDYANIDALVKRFGDEVYIALGISMPIANGVSGKGKKNKKTERMADLEIVAASWPYLTEQQIGNIMGIVGDTGAHEKTGNSSKRRSKAATAN